MLSDSEEGSLRRTLDELRQSHWDTVHEIRASRSGLRYWAATWAAVIVLATAFGSWMFWVKGKSDSIAVTQSEVLAVQAQVHAVHEEVEQTDRTLSEVRDRVNAISVQVCRSCVLPPDPPHER